ncbi:MAG TPA: hypothetical protein VN663_14375 [Ramlibacter sp.]|nr:hypothetical protein [Ramlibacter sp.]
MDLNFDYDAARSAGYSDDDILNGLQKKGLLDFDLGAARKAGYNSTEILSSILPQRAPEPPKESSSLLRRAGDIGISALKGAISVPETAVGLADIVTGGYAGKAAEELGFRPKEAKAALNELYSPEQQAANQRVAEAKGFLPSIGAMVSNPSTLVQTGVESIPSMLAGGAVGRGLVAGAGRLGLGLGEVGAAAAGEGVVGGGQAAEQIRQANENGELTAGQALSALGSGIGTGIFGAVGGRIAHKLGIGDIDTALVNSGAPVQSSKGVIRRLIEGGVSEGVFEELPQSIQEQIWQNAALDKPLLEGVGEQAAQGLLAGGLFGSVAGAALHGHPAAQAAEAVQGEPQRLGYKPDPLLVFPDGSVGRQSDADSFIAGLPEDQRVAARARLYGYQEQQVSENDVLQAQSVNDAIAVANRAIEQGTPEYQAQKADEVGKAWDAYLAEQSQRRQTEYDAAEAARRSQESAAMLEQQRTQQVEQANAITEAQGFNQAEPTAMQLAMQRAQEQRQSRITEAQNPDVTQARAILDAAGVTGNERMRALRSIRTGENTLEDLADAHPPKATNVANQLQNAQPLPQQRIAGAEVPQQLQPAEAAGRTPGAPLAEEPGGAGASGPAVSVPATATGAGETAARTAAALSRITGRHVNGEWNTFSPQSGSLGVPREVMPQVKAEARGALTQFLAARGITHEPAREIPAASLKPTQQEFSEAKVRQAQDYQGGERSILVSSDGYVLDGHHQWLAALANDQPVKAIQLNAPIAKLLDEVHEFPSAETAEGAPQKTAQNIPENIPEDDGSDIPVAFMRRVKVPHEVWVQDENRYETVQLGADKALASVREDITNLEALLKCIRG